MRDKKNSQSELGKDIPACRQRASTRLWVDRAWPFKMCITIEGVECKEDFELGPVLVLPKVISSGYHLCPKQPITAGHQEEKNIYGNNFVHI